jgi:predicted dehydrogenase
LFVKSGGTDQLVDIGIVGMGHMGQMYARLAQENAEAQLAAICETDTRRRSNAERTFGVRGYKSSSDLMNHPGLDAVVVSTPDFSHLEPVLQATEQDLHLLVEKPLATDVEQARRMMTAVKKSSGIGMMAHVFRWSAPFVAAKTALDSGELGIPMAINMRIDDRIFVPTQMLGWADKTTPGWFLLSHAVDLAHWYAGALPIRVYAIGVKKRLLSMGIDTYDLIHADVTFENGFVASLEACWTLPDSLPSMTGACCTLISTEGGQYIDVMDQMIQRAGDRYETPATLRTEMYGRVAGLQSFMFQSFLDSVLRGRPVVTSIEDGLVVVRVLEAVHSSLASGQTQSVRQHIAV